MAIEGATKEVLAASLNLMGKPVWVRQCCQSWGESIEQTDAVWAALLMAVLAQGPLL